MTNGKIDPFEEQGPQPRDLFARLRDTPWRIRRFLIEAKARELGADPDALSDCFDRAYDAERDDA